MFCQIRHALENGALCARVVSVNRLEDAVFQ